MPAASSPSGTDVDRFAVMRRRSLPGAAVAALVVLVVVLVPLGPGLPAGAAGGAASAEGTYRGFSDPEAVTIDGYSATAMEPFISDDGRYLLFNTSNQAP